MGPDFDGNPGPPNTPERLRHPSFGSRNLTFPKNFTLVAQQTIATGLVSQIHPNRDGSSYAFGLHRRLRILSRTATLLHGRSPLHFECVFWELSASPRSRPSHSISERALAASPML